MRNWSLILGGLLAAPLFIDSIRADEPLVIGDDAPTSNAATATDSQQRKNADKEELKGIAHRLLNGMKDGRSRLGSGVVNVTGTFAYRFADRDVRGDVRMHMAFDDALGLLRIDRNEVRDVKDVSSPEENFTASTVPVKLKFVRTPKQTIIWEGPFAPMNVNIDTPSAATPAADLGTLDIHAVGMASIFDLQKGHQEGHTFREIVTAFETDDVVSVRDEGNGVHQIVWEHESNDKILLYRSRLWIDETRGFAPVKYKFDYAPKSQPQSRTDADAIKCTWSKVTDVWVPDTMSCKDANSSYLLTFNWKSVNSKIPESVFAIEDMKLPRFALVCDIRPDNPIVLGQIWNLLERKGQSGEKAVPAH